MLFGFEDAKWGGVDNQPLPAAATAFGARLNQADFHTNSADTGAGYRLGVVPSGYRSGVMDSTPPRHPSYLITQYFKYETCLPGKQPYLAQGMRAQGHQLCQ